jgi:hypothetical protein
MKISKTQLKQIIREEVHAFRLEKYDKDFYLLNEGFITEAEFLKRLGKKAVPWLTTAAIAAGSVASPITAYAEPPPVAAASVGVSQNMNLFLEKYPAAGNKRTKELLNKLVQAKASQAKKQISDTYMSDQNFDSFARFIRSLEGLENQDMQTLEANWKVYSAAIEKRLDNTQVVSYYDDIDSIPSSYIERNIPAFYDSVEKKIFINPLFYINNGGFNHTDFSEDLKEEYIHAAQFAAKEELRMPVAHMQTKSAADMGIFLTQEQSGISQGAYDYLTSPQEFHAKMFKLKSNLAKQSPESLDGNGQIKKEVLLRLMDSENSPEILKVLDPSKIEKVLEFFNMVAQTDTQKTSQIT